MSRRNSETNVSQPPTRNPSPASSILSDEEPDIVGQERMVSKIARAMDHLAHGRVQRAMVNIGQINREFTDQVRSEELANLREALWPEVRRLIQDTRNESDPHDASSRFIIKAYDGSKNRPVDTDTFQKASKYMKELLEGVVNRQQLTQSNDQALTLLRLSNMVAESYKLAPAQQIDLILSMLPEGNLKAIIADSRDEGLPSVFHRVLITNEASESVHSLTNRLLNWHLKPGQNAGQSIDNLQGLLRQLLPLTSNKDYNKKEFLSALLGKIESSVSGDLRERVTGLKQQLARSRMARPTPYYIDLVLGWATRAHPSNFKGKQKEEIIYHAPSLRRPPPGRRGSRGRIWGYRRRTPPPPPRRYQRQVRQVEVGGNPTNQIKQFAGNGPAALNTGQNSPSGFQQRPSRNFMPRQGPPRASYNQYQQNNGRPFRPPLGQSRPRCSIHPSGNHTDAECRVRRGEWGRGRPQNTDLNLYVPPYPEDKQIYLDRGGRRLHPNVESHFAGACYRCGMKNHLAKNCFAYDARAPNSHGLCGVCRRGFHVECKYPGPTFKSSGGPKEVKTLEIESLSRPAGTVNYNYYLQSDAILSEKDHPKN